MSASEDAWSASAYAANARFVSDLGAPVLDLLGDVSGRDVLDLGCGDGALTAEIAARGARVVGVDASADMVAASVARGLDARFVDAAALPFEGSFDAAFSNAALHWMTRPDAVIAGVARALRPGGLFVAEFGGRGNVAAIQTAIIAVLEHHHAMRTTLSDIWYFPGPEEHAARLEAAGFRVEEIALIPRPTPLPGSMAEWLATLAAPVLGTLSEAARSDAISRVEALLAPAMRGPGGDWIADYVRLRFRARLH